MVSRSFVSAFEAFLPASCSYVLSPAPDGSVVKYVLHVARGGSTLCHVPVSSEFLPYDLSACSEAVLQCSSCFNKADLINSKHRSFQVRNDDHVFPDLASVLASSRWSLCSSFYYRSGSCLVKRDPHRHFVVNGSALCNKSLTPKRSHADVSDLPVCHKCLSLLGFTDLVLPLRKSDFRFAFPKEWEEYKRSLKGVKP